MKYIIAAGGTGMRCMEAFIHLCAIGMFDNEEINVLLIDTDHENGNKSRTRDLITIYQDIKKYGKEEGKALDDSFFSAKINLFEFYPAYKSPLNTFNKIRTQSMGDDKEENQDNQDLADLLFEKETQTFDLEHGYRAQTHVGSYLMYYAIIDEVLAVKSGKNKGEKKDNGLSDFIKLFANDPKSKAFIFGSIFGGTGASSLPIIPRAIQAASELQGNINKNISFGATLLTDYFTFNSPTSDQLQSQKVIARANRFRLNSQAALMYYDKDDTVKSAYQRLYLVGWPLRPVDHTDKKKTKVITGGGEQRNKAHVIELICAFAAYDFFKNSRDYDEKIHEWKFKSIQKNQSGEGLDFRFEDFIGTKDSNLFKKKIAAFYGMCFLFNNEYNDLEKAFEQLMALIKRTSSDKYDNSIGGQISPIDSKKIGDYVKYFGFSYNHKGKEINYGWLPQIQSTSSTSQFLFNNDAFAQEYGDMRRVNWGNILPAHGWAKSLNTLSKMFRGSPSFNTFKEELMKDKVEPDTSLIQNPVERGLNWVYNTFNTLHKL